MKKVFHFVPSLDIGGVEIAIKKSLPDLMQKLDISVFYVKRRGSLDVGQRPWWRALKNLITDRPYVVVTSLWWAHPIGFLFKLSGIRWICFIHNSQFAHIVDLLVCTLAIRQADEVAADSNQAAVFVRSIKNMPYVHVIPYVFPLPYNGKIERIKDTFIFVGRNAKEKRMDLVTDFFRHILTKFPGASCRFEIAGDIPTSALNLKEAFGSRVIIKSNSSNTEVFKNLCASEYFVVLSDLEGFCMSAYEAVQAGCFVIYRDVGEIKGYVITDRSFKVADLEKLYDQFDEVFERRRTLDPAKDDLFGQNLSDSNTATYNSSFVELVEMKPMNEKGAK